jgi:NADPH2:quinone reductase
MKAVVMVAAGGPEVLQVREIPTPAPTEPGQVLVRIAAAGVNPLDSRVRKINPYHPDHLPAVLGGDGAGVVEQVGPGCKRWHPGDEVYFFNGAVGGPVTGTYAQYAVVHEDYLARKPASLTLEEAAAVPLVLITAWEALVYRASIEAGQKVLIHAGAGGVGHVAVQLARHLRARVATTVSDDRKAKFVQTLGAETVFNYRQRDFVEAALDWTGGEGVDTVLDTVGGETFLRSIGAVRIYGRVITLLATPLDLAHANKARAKNLLIGYEGMVAPQVLGNHRARLAQTRILEQGARLIEQQKISVVVGETLPLEQAARAHALIDEGHTQGKIVLTVT